MQAADNNIAKAAFNALQIPNPESIIKNGSNAVLTFTNFLNACTFAVALENMAIPPTLKVKGRVSLIGRFECTIPQDSFDMLCRVLNLGDDAFSKLPSLTKWQDILEDKASSVSI